MPSLTEVAKLAGVSLSTASVVLSPGRKQKFVSPGAAAKVRDAAQRLNYVANYHARSMRLGKAHTIGLPLHTGGWKHVEHSRLGNTYFANLAGAVELACAKAGYEMLVFSSHGEETAVQRALKSLEQRRLDGMVIPGVLIPGYANLGLKVLADAPVVVAVPTFPTPLPSVTWEERRGMELAVQHFAELGHRSVLWLGPETNSEDSARRPTLFVEAVWHAGLRCERLTFPRISWDDIRGRPEEVLSDRACEAILPRLRDPERNFTAVMAWNDSVAAGVIRAAWRAGVRIPEELSLIGVDNLNAAILTPRLTSVDHMLMDIGRTSTKLLLDLIEMTPEQRREQAERSIEIEPRLAVRETTAPAREILH